MTNRTQLLAQNASPISLAAPQPWLIAQFTSQDQASFTSYMQPVFAFAFDYPPAWTEVEPTLADQMKHLGDRLGGDLSWLKQFE